MILIFFSILTCMVYFLLLNYRKMPSLTIFKHETFLVVMDCVFWLFSWNVCLFKNLNRNGKLLCKHDACKPYFNVLFSRTYILTHPSWGKGKFKYQIQLIFYSVIWWNWCTLKIEAIKYETTSCMMIDANKAWSWNVHVFFWSAHRPMTQQLQNTSI